MNMEINITDDGIKRYPPHKHLYWEFMIYLHGEGFLYTPEKNYPFKAGTTILVPPGTVHGSVSDNGFKNISIGGDFESLPPSPVPLLIQDNQNRDGVSLAEIIYGNRFSSEAFLNSLCSALVCFFTENINFEDNIYSAVSDCLRKINAAAFDSELNLAEILASSGYAEDYIRAKFKEYVGKTPTAFLTEIRIKRAEFLLDIYGGRLQFQEIMSKCGFTDYAYFSKRFKQLCGVSPREYIRRHDIGAEN